MAKYIMALDQGTTSSRCILFDKAGNICSMAQREFEQIYPKPGWVEHNPMEIWSTQYAVMSEAMALLGAKPNDIAGIGITNQRETTIVWDKETGEPVYNAIVWQCRRTAKDINLLVKDGYADVIKAKTGLVPDAYFSATKIAWILSNVAGARKRQKRADCYSVRLTPGLYGSLQAVRCTLQTILMLQELCFLIFITGAGIKSFLKSSIYQRLCFLR